MALGAVGLGSGLTLAVTLEGDSDGQGVLKTYRFDDEGFLLLFGAPTCTGLHTEGDRVSNLEARAGFKARYDFTIQAGGIE